MVAGNGRRMSQSALDWGVWGCYDPGGRGGAGNVESLRGAVGVAITGWIRGVPSAHTKASGPSAPHTGDLLRPLRISKVTRGGVTFSRHHSNHDRSPS